MLESILAGFVTAKEKSGREADVQDLGRFFSEDGTPYAGSECARKCSRTPGQSRPHPSVPYALRLRASFQLTSLGCTYASVYDDMCELTSLTDVNLKEGGSYQSILQGSCEQNREDHGESRYSGNDTHLVDRRHLVYPMGATH